MTKSHDDSPSDAATAGTEAKTASVPVDLRKEMAKLHAALQKQVKFLLASSSEGLLNRDDSASLVNYIKVLQGLIKDENELLDDMSDEELEQIMKDKK